MAVAGHVSRKMIEHYSHIRRLEAKQLPWTLSQTRFLRRVWHKIGHTRLEEEKPAIRN